MSYVPCMGWGILGIKDGNLEWCMLLFYSNKVFINIGLELDKHYTYAVKKAQNMLFASSPIVFI